MPLIGAMNSDARPDDRRGAERQDVRRLRRRRAALFRQSTEVEAAGGDVVRERLLLQEEVRRLRGGRGHSRLL